MQGRPIWSNVRGKLFLGNKSAALDRSFIEQKKISRILSVTDNPDHRPSQKFCEGSGITQRIYPVQDTSFADSESRLVREVLPWMKKTEEEGIGLLVHCYAGVSRSSSLMITYLTMELLSEGIIEDTPLDLAFGVALELVLHRHNIAAPIPETLRSFFEAVGLELPAIYREIYDLVLSPKANRA